MALDSHKAIILTKCSQTCNEGAILSNVIGWWPDMRVFFHPCQWGHFITMQLSALALNEIGLLKRFSAPNTTPFQFIISQIGLKFCPSVELREIVFVCVFKKKNSNYEQRTGKIDENIRLKGDNSDSFHIGVNFLSVCKFGVHFLL